MLSIRLGTPTGTAIVTQVPTRSELGDRNPHILSLRFSHIHTWTIDFWPCCCSSPSSRAAFVCFTSSRRCGRCGCCVSVFPGLLGRGSTWHGHLGSRVSSHCLVNNHCIQWSSAVPDHSWISLDFTILMGVIPTSGAHYHSYFRLFPMTFALHPCSHNPIRPRRPLGQFHPPRAAERFHIFGLHMALKAMVSCKIFHNAINQSFEMY